MPVPTLPLPRNRRIVIKCMNAPTIYPQLEEWQLAYLLEELSIYLSLSITGQTLKLPVKARH